MSDFDVIQFITFWSYFSRSIPYDYKFPVVEVKNDDVAVEVMDMIK